jgi:trehalose 6-phosphate phosphatase
MPTFFVSQCELEGLAMLNVLSPLAREAVAQLAAAKALIALDYDGTLAPIVDEPGEARMRGTTRALLAALVRRYRVIVISGRAQPDVMRKLRGTSVDEVIGNHGIEPWAANTAMMDRVQSWRPVLDASLAELAGVTIEDKIFSIAVHYRRVADKTAAHAAIRRVAATLAEVRVVGGKDVVNLLPQGAPHKGMALQKALERWSCERAIFVGDDETDEDVFACADAQRVLTVRVGANHLSRAAYYLDDQPNIDALLALLLQLRSKAAPLGSTVPRAR